jgi:PKD repeat protein
MSLVLLLVLASFTFLAPPSAADWPPPVADAGQDQTVSEGEEVTLDGSGSYDLNDDPLTYYWDFDDSNGSDDRDAVGVTVTTKYADSGVYTATLHVKDQDREDTDTCRITVIPREPDNTPPVAVIVAPTPGVYNVSQAIDFEAQAFDADDDRLTGKWDFGDDTTSNQPITTHTYTSEGPKYITFTVNDGTTNTTARRLIMIGEEVNPETNRRPDAVFNYTPRNPSVGQVVTFDASNSSDPDDDPLEFEWDFDTDGLPETDKTGRIVTWVYNDTGNFDVTLQVRDGKQGGWDYAQRTVEVDEEPNDPPLANAGNDAEVQVGVSLTFRGTATDPDGDNITLYMWDFGDGGHWESDSGGQTNHTYTAAGTYSATFTVEDERGERGTDTRSITVNPPPDMPPRAFAGEDMTVMQGETAVFQGKGTDDFGIAKYEWDFNSDNVWDFESDRNGDATWVYPDPGIYTAILRVTDDPRPGLPGPGQTNEDSLLVTVTQNQPPEAKIRVTTLFVQAGELVSFQSDSEDPEGVIEDYAWDLDGDGRTDSNVANPRYTYRREGNYQVSLTVTDDYGQSDTDRVTIQVSQSYSVEIEITSPVRDLDPGQTWEFRATVTNTGNGNDQLRISLSGPNNAWATLDKAVIDLNASEKQTVTITVKVPASALSTDEARITVTATSNYGSASEASDIEVYVKQHYQVSTVISEDSITTDKGQTKEAVATITITNDGNGPDTFRISFSGDIAGYLRTSTPKVDLAPGASKDVTISIDVAESAPTGKAGGTIIVASTKSTAKQQLDFEVDIKGDTGGGSSFEFDSLTMMIVVVIVLALIAGILVSSSRKKGKVNGGTR